MKKSKKGSTLIIVVIIFMFVTMVSVAMLSMITSNYYGRTSENKRIQNLYGSDSGIDIAYNIIVKTIEAASIYSNNEVNNMIKNVKNMDYDEYNHLADSDDQKALYALYEDIKYWKNYNSNLKDDEQDKWMTEKKIDDKVNWDKEDIDNLTNNIFRNNFKSFIVNRLKSSLESGEYIGYVIENSALIEYVKTVDMSSVDVYVGKQSTKEVDSEYNDVILKTLGDDVILTKSLKVEIGYGDDGIIQYNTYTPPTMTNEQIKFNNYEEYSITLTSEFKSDSNNENTAKLGENQRIIEADFTIRVPNYNEVSFKQNIIDNTEMNDIVGLTIGGDMMVTDVNKLNVTGDIFIEGRDNDVIDEFKGNRTYEKYSGGIILNNISGNKHINFNNNVYTRGSFNLKNNVDVVINGDLYSKNIYAGDGNDVSENSVLTVGKEVVVDNDLTVKAINTAINLTDFYGINDINLGDEGKYKKSSSIIINAYKDVNNASRNPSSITISNKAYIMGVAHINTISGYQTGESIAVKSNYNAYSASINGSETFVNDNPLRVLDEPLMPKKSEHFWKFWQDKITGTNTVDCGGVILQKDKTYSVGAVVYEEINKTTGEKMKNVDQQLKFVSDIVAEDNINSKKSDYAKHVFNIAPNDLTEDELLTQYNTNLSGTDVQTVSNLLANMSQLQNSDYKYKTNKIYINSGEKMAIIGQENKNIVIKGSGCRNSYSRDDYVVIDVTTNKNINAIIVTPGNVFIDGEVNFNGNIIAGGDLNILGNSTVNIYYNKNITREIQKENGLLFSQIFGNGFGGQILGNASVDIKSNPNNFLKSNSWRIVK